MQRTHPTKTSAFTMVELSVVLVIIGLLVGGVMMGVKLLNQTEIKTILTDFSKYSTAVTQFRQQYGGFPGDLIDATSYWGDDATAAVGCADGDATNNGAPGSCNGDNDGQISTIAVTGCYLPTGATTATCEEPYRAWQQLVLAAYLQGNFSGRGGGVAAGAGTAATLATNVPRSRIQNAGWSFGYKATTAGDTDMYNQDLSNYLAFGSAIAASSLTRGPVITPTHAWQLDTKMDNGLPGTGRILSMKPAFVSTPNCATSAVDATAAYNVTNTSDACSLMMSLTLK